MNNDIPKLQGYMIFNGNDGKWCRGLEHLVCEKHIRQLWHARSEQDSTMDSAEMLPLEMFSSKWEWTKCQFSN